jgi:hypothetical protein
MYRVKVTFGISYSPIHSWRKWEMDDAFLVFVWGKDKKTLIVRIDDIQAIEGL